MELCCACSQREQEVKTLHRRVLHFALPSPFSPPCSLGISVGRVLPPSQEQRCSLALLEINPGPAPAPLPLLPECHHSARLVGGEQSFVSPWSIPLPPSNPRKPRLGPPQQQVMLRHQRLKLKKLFKKKFHMFLKKTPN